MNDTSELMFRNEAAAYLRRPEETLKHWAYKKVGPPFARIGSRVMYRKSDLDAYVQAQFDAEEKKRATA